MADADQISGLASLLGKDPEDVTSGLERLHKSGLWVRFTERIEELVSVSRIEASQLLSYGHHVQGILPLFQQHFSHQKHLSVIFGHKRQGKSQFLYFVSCFLKAIGETVVYLDHTVLPDEDGIIVIRDDFCGHLWKDDILLISSLSDSCQTFFDFPEAIKFRNFFRNLDKYSSGGNRVWVLIDEVVRFVKLGIALPEEKKRSSFNYIITGSAGIGTFVSTRHIEKFVFDLPLFSRDEGFVLANQIAHALHVNLADAIPGIRDEGIPEWLEERFGGIPGYSSEFLLGVKKGESYSKYALELSERVRIVIRNTAKEQNMSPKELSDCWMSEIQDPRYTWESIRDSGLCGSHPPRGVVLTELLKWLFTYSPSELDKLSIVQLMRRMSQGDPGLDGCLLELEEIIKLKTKSTIRVAKISLHKDGADDLGTWVDGDEVELPASEESVSLTRYSDLNGTYFFPVFDLNCAWILIELPSGFDVADLFLFHVRSSTLYAVQITRSADPFKKHHTLETCPKCSQDRIMEFSKGLVRDTGVPEDSLSCHFVMVAPNCAPGKFAPPAGNQGDFYFSPPTVLGSRKRKISASAKQKKSKSTKTG